MREKIVMPKLTSTMTEGTIRKWLKNVGDLVKAGEPLLEIETDKATQVVEAPVSGTVAEILVLEGEEILVSQAIGSIEIDGE